jgi:hypothetical protein
MTREHGTPGRYKDGCRCLPCRKAGRAYAQNRSRQIAYGRWEHQADSTGTRRRIQALAYCGWPLTWLSARLGGDPTHARKILERTRVTAATERAVRALYDELWDAGPPVVTVWDRRAVAKAREDARARGFVPPLAWDEDAIDDPQASPAEGWQRGDGREYGSLTEEAVELARQDEHPEMIALRLGASQKTVERTLVRAGVPVWRAA